MYMYAEDVDEKRLSYFSGSLDLSNFNFLAIKIRLSNSWIAFPSG